MTAMLTGAVPQPAAAGSETPEWLRHCAATIDSSFSSLRDSLRSARLDALVVLVADRGRAFDDANCPQLHIYAGDSIWGNTALDRLGEAACIKRHHCDGMTADVLIEALFDAGFDVAESHGLFSPAGDPDHGAVAALLEPLERLESGLPIIPIHVNCHVKPMLSGRRALEFGAALGAAMAHCPKRLGILVSGGMSGDPGGYLAGWIDPMLDRWVLRQLETGRSSRLSAMFDVDSDALRGSTAEIRLWSAAAAALESQGAVGRSIAYLPLHAATVGVGFFIWETPPCL